MINPNGENICNWGAWVKGVKEFYVLLFQSSDTDGFYKSIGFKEQEIIIAYMDITLKDFRIFLYPFEQCVI